jgi:uncharacterized protein with HEPN domain
MGMKTKNYTDPLIPIYIDEMIAAINKILKYTQGMTFSQFMDNAMVCDAVQHQFEILGEASNHLPFSLRKKFPHIPFSLMYSLRNHIAHEYFDVDYEIIWHIIQVDLPTNLRDFASMRQSAAVAAVLSE